MVGVSWVMTVLLTKTKETTTKTPSPFRNPKNHLISPLKHSYPLSLIFRQVNFAKRDILQGRGIIFRVVNGLLMLSMHWMSAFHLGIARVWKRNCLQRPPVSCVQDCTLCVLPDTTIPNGVTLNEPLPNCPVFRYGTERPSFIPPVPLHTLVMSVSL